MSLVQNRADSQTQDGHTYICFRFLFLFLFGYQNLLSTQCASIINIELGEKYLMNPQLLNTKTKSLNCIRKPLNCITKSLNCVERKNWHLQVFLKVSTNLVIDAIAKCYRRKHVRHKVQCGGGGMHYGRLVIKSSKKNLYAKSSKLSRKYIFRT